MSPKANMFSYENKRMKFPGNVNSKHSFSWTSYLTPLLTLSAFCFQSRNQLMASRRSTFMAGGNGNLCRYRLPDDTELSI